jgi:hypothetical protein
MLVPMKDLFFCKVILRGIHPVQIISDPLDTLLLILVHSIETEVKGLVNNITALAHPQFFMAP